MEPIFFTENQPSETKSVRKDPLDDQKDPRSHAYVRTLNRPKINWLIIFLYWAIPAAVLTALGWILTCLGVYWLWAVLISLTIFAVYGILMLKRAAICMVKIYQRYTPASIRNRCRFEPSCSEYMLLSIHKYGVIKGVFKGLGRLKRCNVNGGGFDYP